MLLSEGICSEEAVTHVVPGQRVTASDVGKQCKDEKVKGLRWIVWLSLLCLFASLENGEEAYTYML